MAIANLTATLPVSDQSGPRHQDQFSIVGPEEQQMISEKHKRPLSSQHGFSFIELMLVIALGGILTGIAVPQLISQRRLTRSAAVTREILGQMRYARQLAMSQRRAFTFQYDDTAKQINIIGPIPAGTAALLDATYPLNAGSGTVAWTPLTKGGLSASEITYGIPTLATGLPSGAATIPTGALGDGVTMTALTTSKLNITFQPDGSVIDTNGLPLDRAMYIFNNKAAQASASAISVLGSSGRVKVWRYMISGNNYAE